MYVIMLKTIENILNTVEKIFLQILFVAMTLVVLIAVFNRITVNAQMAWSDELSRYLFVWLTFIAAAYAAGGKAHIGVTALVDIFPPAMKRVVELLTYLLCLGLRRHRIRSKYSCCHDDRRQRCQNHNRLRFPKTHNIFNPSLHTILPKS